VVAAGLGTVTWRWRADQEATLVDDPEQQVKDLLTQAEHAIFLASLPANLPSLTDRELRGEITRCRQARDKYRDLYQRQATSSRQKRRSRGEALSENERTGRKADVFDDALARLEQGLALRQSEEEEPEPPDLAPPTAEVIPEAPLTNRAARRAAESSDKGGVPTFVNDAAVDAYRRSSSLAGPTAKHISAARSAAGRRFQAKKDGR
jgi:hypothetical protein